MSVSESNEFLAWNEGQKDVVFDNERLVEAYCQDDVSMLREACRILWREFIDRKHRLVSRICHYRVGM